jgi:hypothetical protein
MRLFGLGEAYQDVKKSNGALDTSLAIGILLGKTVLNTGMLVLDQAAKKTKVTSNSILEDCDSSDSQREKAKEMNDKSDNWIKKRRLSEINYELSNSKLDLNKTEKLIKELSNGVGNSEENRLALINAEENILSLESKIRRLEYELEKLKSQ